MLEAAPNIERIREFRPERTSQIQSYSKITFGVQCASLHLFDGVHVVLFGITGSE
jgi:hypothetical protein